MYCTSCGSKINEEDSFCTNCGAKKQNVETSNNETPKEENKVVPKQEVVEEDEKNANLLCILSLIFKYGGSVISGILSVIFAPLGELFSGLAPLTWLTGIVLMIVARIKYPSNKFAKVLMWIYIIETILSIVLFIILIAACIMTCNSMDTSGCA